jgi:hypothetical protein
MKVTGFSIVSLSAFGVVLAQDPPKGGGPPGRGGKGFGGALNTPEGLASVGTGKFSPPVSPFRLQFVAENLTAE